MASRHSVSFDLLVFLFVLAFSGLSAAKAQPAVARQIGLGDRIACQTAIEEVYWRHRSSGAENAPKLPFNQAVPQELIRRKAEDAILKSLALERYWNVRITAEQLQAELNRMASQSRSREVLRELFAALGNDADVAAECLARPLLADRLIQTYYAYDERFHGKLKAQAQASLARASSLARAGGQYREVEWQRRTSASSHLPTPNVVAMEPALFDARIRELRGSLADRGGKLPLGRVSPLREDDSRFYALSVLALDDQHVRLTTAEWPKMPFESWWLQARTDLPMQLNAEAFRFRLPQVGGSQCRDDSWLPTAQLLDPRYWHTAVWTGSEMIVFGGMSSVGTVYNDGARYNPATDTWTHVATKGGPSARVMHVAVWTGKEMVVWGGTGDTTGGRYNPVTDTWKPMNTTGAPAWRFYASAVWTGQEMLVWGGEDGGTLNDGGRYNPATNSWSAMAKPVLAPRAYQAAVWTGAEMVVWGGYDGFIGKMYGDGARYNPTTNSWKSVSSQNAPNARYFHTAVWTGTEMIVWGGINYPNYDLSGGRYNPSTNTWTPTSLINAPSLRWMHMAVWTGKEMVVEGGTPANAAGGRYDPATDVWTSTNPRNAAVNGQGITAVWTGKEMILWGGLDDDFIFHNDGGRYNPAKDRWLRTSTMNVPAARGLHSAVWTGSEMIVWGGYTGTYPNTGGRYDPATDSWRTTSTVGAPGGRENAAAVWTGAEAMFWGGDPDNYPQGTGGRYNPVSDSWKLITNTNAPFQRYGHTGVWTGTEMIIFGGMADDDAGWRYNPATDTWKSTSVLNGPGARYLPAAVWSGSEMLIWGGMLFDLNSPVGSRYDPATDTWTEINKSGSPVVREWPVNVWTGSEMIVWGGQNLNKGEVYNDGGRYNPVTNSWKNTSQIGAPSPRVGQGVWSGSELVIWGGDWDSSGGRYHPASDSWKPTSRVNAPPVRGGGRWSTVWTGYQMIIWGGIIETQQGNLYCASGVPNSPPIAVDDSYTAKQNKKFVAGTKISVLINDSDPNGDLLTAVRMSRPAHGTLVFNSNGTFTYKPVAGFVGSDSFTYKANDGVASSNVATVTITVQ